MHRLQHQRNCFLEHRRRCRTIVPQFRRLSHGPRRERDGQHVTVAKGSIAERRLQRQGAEARREVRRAERQKAEGGHRLHREVQEQHEAWYRNRDRHRQGQLQGLCEGDVQDCESKQKIDHQQFGEGAVYSRKWLGSGEDIGSVRTGEDRAGADPP